MHIRQFSRGMIVVMALVLALGGFAVHTHEIGSNDDCCLYPHASCPDPGAESANELDRPAPRAWHAITVDQAPAAPAPADAVLRRGPPFSIA